MNHGIARLFDVCTSQSPVRRWCGQLRRGSEQGLCFRDTAKCRDRLMDDSGQPFGGAHNPLTACWI